MQTTAVCLVTVVVFVVVDVVVVVCTTCCCRCWHWKDSKTNPVSSLLLIQKYKKLFQAAPPCVFSERENSDREREIEREIQQCCRLAQTPTNGKRRDRDLFVAPRSA